MSEQMGEELFLLIKEEIDFHTIYGIYSDITEAENDYRNLIKYNHIEKGDLHLYILEKNKFYKDENYKELEVL